MCVYCMCVCVSGNSMDVCMCVYGHENSAFLCVSLFVSVCVRVCACMCVGTSPAVADETFLPAGLPVHHFSTMTIPLHGPANLVSRLSSSIIIPHSPTHTALQSLHGDQRTQNTDSARHETAVQTCNRRGNRSIC